MEQTNSDKKANSSTARMKDGGCENNKSRAFFRGNHQDALQVHGKDKSASQHIAIRMLAH